MDSLDIVLRLLVQHSSTVRFNARALALTCKASRKECEIVREWYLWWSRGRLYREVIVEACDLLFCVKQGYRTFATPCSARAASESIRLWRIDSRCTRRHAYLTHRHKFFVCDGEIRLDRMIGDSDTNYNTFPSRGFGPETETWRCEESCLDHHKRTCISENHDPEHKDRSRLSGWFSLSIELKQSAYNLDLLCAWHDLGGIVYYSSH